MNGSRGAAPVRLALPAAEGGVAGERPAPRVVVEVLGPADLVNDRQALLERLLRVVEELGLVGRPARPALGTGAVVADDHDDGVVEDALLAQEVEQPAEVVVGVAQEAREHLHHPRRQAACLGRQRRPIRHVRVVARQLGVSRQDAELLLAGERLLAVGVPTVVELAGVAVGPLLGHVVRRVGRPEAQVQVEGFVGVDLAKVRDELDRLVDEVLRQVVALLGRLRWLDRVVVVDELGVPLARVAAQEAVEALETAPQGPAVVGTGGSLEDARRQVPLADHVRAVAVLQQHLREHPVLERHDPVVAGVAGRELGDAGHAVAVVVPPGDDAGAARRTERCRVHVVEAEPFGRERVEVRRGDRAPVAPELAEPGVVENDEQDIRGALARSRGRRPRRGRLVRGAADHTRECGACGVFDDGHSRSSLHSVAGASVVSAATRGIDHAEPEATVLRHTMPAPGPVSPRQVGGSRSCGRRSASESRRAQNGGQGHRVRPEEVPL